MLGEYYIKVNDDVYLSSNTSIQGPTTQIRTQNHQTDEHLSKKNAHRDFSSKEIIFQGRTMNLRTSLEL